LANGQSQWLTGVDAREDVQRWRAQSCAILSTAETVKADKAMLNVRSEAVTCLENGAIRQPLRVILDRRCRLTGDEPLFQQGGDILLCHAGPAEEWPELAPAKEPSARQVMRVRLGLDDVGQFDLDELLRMLGSRQINSLWVEAGSMLATSFWQRRLIDEFVLYQAPMLLGADALPMLKAGGLNQLAQAPRWQWQDVRLIGADLRLTALLKKSAPSER
jgi:diaminohydroxyphosphoribosylaminopyrimidine deaminase/5-amino-6-(5-phosphoribosylamino)uracil reductase